MDPLAFRNPTTQVINLVEPWKDQKIVEIKFS